MLYVAGCCIAADAPIWAAAVPYDPIIHHLTGEYPSIGGLN